MRTTVPPVAITVGERRLVGRLEVELAPRTCAAFLDMLPLEGHLLHVRWSGEAAWVPLGDRTFDPPLPPENATAHPVPGQVLLYAGQLSEVELLVPYGGTHFGCRAGELAGNHFLTLLEGAEHLRELGRLVLWHGAQPARFALADDG
jgi:hypothetical protein